MVSLPSSSDSDSVDSRDTRQREDDYYMEIYASEAARKCTEEKRDYVWDWAIRAQTELVALRKEHGEVKSLVDFLSDNDVNQGIALMKCIAENGALKRRLKWHEGWSTMAFVLLVFAVASAFWLKN